MNDQDTNTQTFKDLSKPLLGRLNDIRAAAQLTCLSLHNALCSHLNTQTNGRFNQASFQNWARDSLWPGTDMDVAMKNAEFSGKTDDLIAVEQQASALLSSLCENDLSCLRSQHVTHFAVGVLIVGDQLYIVCSVFKQLLLNLGWLMLSSRAA